MKCEHGTDSDCDCFMCIIEEGYLDEVESMCRSCGGYGSTK